jgi:hypothetical protein
VSFLNQVLCLISFFLLLLLFSFSVNLRMPAAVAAAAAAVAAVLTVDEHLVVSSPLLVQ